MGWGATAAVALVTGIVTAAATVYLVYVCVEWYRLRTHDGGDLGYFLVFVPLGFLGGILVGAVVARVVPGYWTAQGISLGAVLALCAITGLVARAFGEVAPELDGDKLLLQVELKYPRSWQPDNESKRPEARSCRLLPVGPWRRTGKPVQGNLLWPNSKQVDGHWVVPCDVMLLSSREVRLVDVTLGKSWVDFNLRMPPQPSDKDKEWSEWIEEGFASEDGKVPVTGYAYRCRVQRIGDIRDREAQASTAFWEERDKAAAAIPPDAPVERWLPLFEDPDGSPAAYRWGGADRIERRAVGARVLELAPSLRSSDRTVMRQAVFALGALSQTPQPLLEPLLAAGQLIPVLIREARAVPVSADGRDSDHQKSETRALQYFSMWTNSINNAQPSAWARFSGILQEIAREAEATHSNGDVAIIAREAKEHLEKLNPAAGRLY
jgi:hypothetical protein